MYKRKIPPTTTTSEIQPLLLTIPQAAVMLGIGKDMVYDLIRRGSLPAVNLGEPGKRSKLRVSQAALHAWVTEQERRQNPYHDLLMSTQPDEKAGKRLRGARKGLAHPEKLMAALPASRQRPSRSS